VIAVRLLTNKYVTISINPFLKMICTMLEMILNLKIIFCKLYKYMFSKYRDYSVKKHKKTRDFT